MGGEGDERDAPVREDIEAIGFYGAAFDGAAGAGGEVREEAEEEGADGLFVVRSGLDVHERSG